MKTHRLTYEPLSLDNIPALAKLLANADVYAHVEEKTPSVDWVERTLRASHAGPKPDAEPQIWHHFAVRLTETGSFVGSIQATLHNDVFELGFLFARDYWGQSIAFEALSWLQDDFLRELEPTNFWATTSPNNHRCQALLSRLGYSQVDYTGEPKLYSCVPSDLVYRRARA